MYFIKTLAMNFHVAFHHDVDNKKTNCVVYYGDHPKDNPKVTYATTTAYAHPKDPFIKHVGRKVALDKFLRTTNLDRAERKQFWHTCFPEFVPVKKNK